MHYPQAVVPITLYEQSDAQLRELAHRSVKVAEPKKVRAAFKFGMIICAISVIGLPLALILSSYRKHKNMKREDTNFNRLKELRDMQIMHYVHEPVEIHWQGNARPKMVFKPDTNLLVHAKRANPECERFDLAELRTAHEA